jgi:hypothetical protein
MGFSVPIDQTVARVGTKLTDQSRAVTKQLFTKVIMKTPVRTGKTRANWNVSANVPDLSVTPSTNVARALSEVEKVDTFPVGTRVYLANGTPAAAALEYGLYPNPPKKPTGRTINGFSSQAPYGMIRISIAEMRL